MVSNFTLAYSLFQAELPRRPWPARSTLTLERLVSLSFVSAHDNRSIMLVYMIRREQ